MRTILDDVPKRIWVKANDKEALTVEEIMGETGESRGWCYQFLKDSMKSGKYEVVWKLSHNGRPIKAYRRKK